MTTQHATAALRTTVVITLLVAISQANAEKWVNVGTVEPVNQDIYADADSAIRTGDLAKIKFKALADQKIDEASFDCVKNILFAPTGEQFSTLKPIGGKGITWPVSLTQRLQGLACKRWFEFWK